MTNPGDPVGVNFVCLGNICRSPMAEAIFLHLLNQHGLGASFRVVSSAVGNWHEGELIHPGTQAILKQKRVPFNPEKRATVLRVSDFKRYRYILALDQEIARSIEHMYGHKVKRLMEYAPAGQPLDVPDPYYNHNFSLVYDMVSAACMGLLAYIRTEEKI